MKTTFKSVLFLAAMFPVFASAQQIPNAQTVNTIGGILDLISSIMNAGIGLLITLGVLVFIWGLVKYLWTVGESKAEGLQTMLWGTLAIFFMVSIWGMVNVIKNTLNLDTRASTAPTGPAVNAGSNVDFNPYRGAGNIQRAINETNR